MNIQDIQPDISIRIHNPDDLNNLLYVEENCFEDTWGERDFLYWMSQADFLIAEIDYKVIGYLGLLSGVKEAKIINLAVLPSYRRKSIGYKLVLESLKILKKKKIDKLNLEVGRFNTEAQLFYKKLGFRKISTLENFYPNTAEDAFLMELNISNCSL